MKTYIGDTQINKSFLGDNQINSKNIGITTIPIDPSTIPGLLIWLDPTKNTITTGASGNIGSISNEGSAFNTWDFPTEFDTLLANFVRGEGDTRYYKFQSGGGYMTTIFKNGLTYTPKTIISIAQGSTEFGSGIWSISNGTATRSGIRHPAVTDVTTLDVSSQIIGGAAFRYRSSPSLGNYGKTEFNSDYAFFSAKSDDFTIDDNITVQSWIDGATPTTYEVGSNPILPTTNYNVSPGTSQRPGSGGVQHHVAHIVYDSVLTEAQINGIYQYYINRGYPLKFAPIT